MDENADMLKGIRKARFSNDKHLTKKDALFFFDTFLDRARIVEGTEPKLIEATQQIFKLGFAGFLRNHLGNYISFPPMSELEPIAALAEEAVAGQQLASFKSARYLTSNIMKREQGVELDRMFL